MTTEKKNGTFRLRKANYRQAATLKPIPTGLRRRCAELRSIAVHARLAKRKRWEATGDYREARRSRPKPDRKFPRNFAKSQRKKPSNVSTNGGSSEKSTMTKWNVCEPSYKPTAKHCAQWQRRFNLWI